MGRESVARQSRRRFGGLLVAPFLARAGLDFPFKIRSRLLCCSMLPEAKTAEGQTPSGQCCAHSIASETSEERRVDDVIVGS